MTDETQVAVFDERAIDRQYFDLRKTGLIVKGSPSFVKWEDMGKIIRMMEGAVLWWWGDWINYGEKQYGEMYSQALDESDYEYQTLRNAVWVAGRIEMSRRLDNLSWGHHQMVAALEPEQQDKWLALAVLENWSGHTLRKMLKVSEKEKEVPEAYCYVSDKLECLALKYYKAFLLESNPKENRYVWLPSWDDKCKGSCLALGLCRDAVAAMTSSEQFKEMTVSINKKEREKREGTNG